MSVNVLNGNWKKSNTDLQVNTLSTSVSPVLSINFGTVINLSDEYDVWRLLMDGSIIPVNGRTTFAMSYSGFEPETNNGVFHVYIYENASSVALGVATISPNNNLLWDLSIHNLSPINLTNLLIMVRRVKFT